MELRSVVIHIETPELRPPGPQEGTWVQPPVVEGAAWDLAVLIREAFPDRPIMVVIEGGNPRAPVSIRVDRINADDPEEIQTCLQFARQIAGQHAGWTVERRNQFGPRPPQARGELAP